MTHLTRKGWERWVVMPTYLKIWSIVIKLFLSTLIKVLGDYLHLLSLDTIHSINPLIGSPKWLKDCFYRNRFHFNIISLNFSALWWLSYYKKCEKVWEDLAIIRNWQHFTFWAKGKGAKEFSTQQELWNRVNFKYKNGKGWKLEFFTT